MTVQWPIAKLDLVNSALTQTGNLPVATEDDGSDEWNVCSPAYERAMAAMLETHGWKSATKVGPLTASPTPPTDTAWDTAYPLPQDLLHLIWVRMDRSTTDPTQSIRGVPVLYDILANQIVVNAQGGPPPPDVPQTPWVVTAKWVSTDNSDPTSETPLFIVALERFVMAGIYRGLHEDIQTAQAMTQEAQMLAQQSRTRHDQQTPKRQFWNSRITAARRVRRPWPQRGNYDWGGPGSPQ